MSNSRSRFIADEDEVEAIFGEALEGMLDDDAEDEFIESDHPRGQPSNSGQFVEAARSKKSQAREAFAAQRGQPENAAQFAEAGSGGGKIPSRAKYALGLGRHFWQSGSRQRKIIDIKAREIWVALGKEMRRQLSEKETTVVSFYSAVGGYQMNQLLNGVKDTYNELKYDDKFSYMKWRSEDFDGDPRYIPKHDVELEKDISIMDAAVAKEQLPHDLIVYRGMNIDSFFEKFGRKPSDLVGRVITNKGFTSVAVNPYVAEVFATSETPTDKKEIVAEIALPKGQHALHMGGLSHWGQRQTELVLPRGMRYRVTGISTDQKPIIITMEPVDKTSDEVLDATDEFIESEHPRDDEEKTHHLRENDPGGVQITDPDDVDGVQGKITALTAKRDKALAEGKEKLARAIGAVIEKLRNGE